MHAVIAVHSDFSGANLTGVDLANATLNSSSFQGADLTGARMWQVNLSLTHLEGADLTGADLTGAVCGLTRWTDGSVRSGVMCPLAPGLQQ